MESHLQDKQRPIQAYSNVLWTNQLPSNLPSNDRHHLQRGSLLCTDFAYRADRLIPCSAIIYMVTSTSPWHGLSALELLVRSQLQLRVYSIIELPKYFKAKLTRYCS